MSERNLRQFLATVVESQDREYAMAWPARDVAISQPLVAAITDVLANSVTAWETGSILEPSIDKVNTQIIDTIVAQRFVVFSHCQTTRRDDGGFHGRG